MESFRELERRYRREPVQLVEHDGASGVLRLRGRKSKLRVTSDAHVDVEPPDDSGWFDLRVRSSSGRELLLHHSIVLSSGTSHRGDGCVAHQLTVMPNVLIEDTRALADGNRVQTISFRARGLRHFFHYQAVETLDVSRAQPSSAEVLRGMRYNPEREGGPFSPESLYAVHDVPPLPPFRVDDRTYRIWFGGSFRGGSWSRIDARTYPVAQVTFDQPVSIDEALDRAWEWRRLFAQIAMSPLRFQAMVVGAPQTDTVTANVYLSNLERRTPTETGFNALSPRNAPLCSWGDRDQLCEAMRQWLSRDASRRRFRVRVDRVISQMIRRIDPSDLVDISAAVESLDDLDSPLQVSTDTISAMSDAAHAVSSAHLVEVSRERISGLLGSLRRTSLANRFISLGSSLSPPLAPEDARLLARSASSIRNSVAHGGAQGAQLQPRIAPTVEALTALCIRFDLETSGFPSHAITATSPTLPRMRLENALAQLRQIGLAAKH